MSTGSLSKSKVCACVQKSDANRGYKVGCVLSSFLVLSRSMPLLSLENVRNTNLTSSASYDK